MARKAEVNKQGVFQGTMIEEGDNVRILVDDLTIGANLVASTLGVFVEGTSGSYSKTFSAPALQGGKQYTISYDIEAENAIAATSGSTYYRVGTDLSIKNNSDTYNYYGKWIALSTSTPYTFKGRLSNTFTVTSAYKNSNSLGIYIQGLGSGRVRISNLKLEEGSITTPWVPNSADAVYSNLDFASANPNIHDPIKAADFYEI